MWSSGKIAIAFTACAAGSACGIAAAQIYFTSSRVSLRESLDAELMAARQAEVTGTIEAAQFCSDKHRDQRRPYRTREPFVNHFLRVAGILKDHGVQDVSVLQASLLFGVVTESYTSLRELREKFGSKVAGIVEELTEDGKVPVYLRPQKMLARTKGLSREARIVLLAHKLDTILDLLEATPPDWEVHQVESCCKWTEQVVISVSGTHAGLEKNLTDLFRVMHLKILFAAKEEAPFERTPAAAA